MNNKNHKISHHLANVQVLFFLLLFASASYADNSNPRPVDIGFNLGRMIGLIFGSLVAISLLKSTFGGLTKKILSFFKSSSTGRQSSNHAELAQRRAAEEQPNREGVKSGKDVRKRIEYPGEVTTKKCPKCAEEIKLEAIVCRYCHHHFREDEVAKDISQIKEQAEIARSRKTSQKKPRGMESVGGLRTFAGAFLLLIGISFILVCFIDVLISPYSMGETVGSIMLILVTILIFILPGARMLPKTRKSRLGEKQDLEFDGTLSSSRIRRKNEHRINNCEGQRGGMKQLVGSVIRSIGGTFVLLVMWFLVTGGRWEDLMTDPRYLQLLGFMALVGVGHSFWESRQENKTAKQYRSFLPSKRGGEKKNEGNPKSKCSKKK